MELTDESKSLITDINSSAESAKSIYDIAFESIIPQGVEIPKPEVIFGLDGIPVFTKKSISTLIGKAKSGKTTCTAWVMAQTIKMNLNVLWIDTEQGDYYGSRTQFWILNIAQMTDSQYLKYSDMKEQNPTIRAKVLEILISEYKPDIVVIDGIRDLVFDINNPEEATITTGNIMKLASVNNCHILSILHQNKGNEHARGHLGSEMINKSETVIEVSQDENNTTICKPAFTRGEPFPIFAFQRDTHGIPQLVNYQPKITSGESNSKKALPIDIDKSTHSDCLKQAFGLEIQLSYSELTSAICAAFEYYGMAMGVVRSKSFIQFYIQNNYIEKAEKNSNRTFYKIKSLV